MNLRTSISLLLLFLCSQALFPQANVRIARNEFRTDKPGFEAAWKSVGRGDKLYSAGVLRYPEAIAEYSVAYQYNAENAELNYKLGVCYLYTSSRERSLGYFLKAHSLKPSVSEDILLLTGRAYQYNGQFIEAVAKYTEYLETNTKKSPEILSRVRRYIDEGNSGMFIGADTARIEVLNAGNNINSSFDDYSPVLNNNDTRLYYASRRPTGRNTAGSYTDEMPDENIFISTFHDGSWGLGQVLEGKITTMYCEAPLYMSQDGNLMYIYAGFRGDGDIMVTRLKKGIWSKPRPFNGWINSLFAETSVAFSPCGDEMAFISARKKDSAGGKDIYISKKRGNRWEKPENIAILNTPMDEESVAYSRGGDTLWFSSRGHNSIGGFDIFFSERQPDGRWGIPVNAGMPFNSVYDDIYLRPSMMNDSLFWFVSNRSGGFGGLDIYSARILPPIPEPEPEPVPVPEPEPVVPEPIRITDTVVIVREVIREVQPEVKESVFNLEGRVLDTKDEAPLVARIDIIDPDTYQVVASLLTSEADGSFRVNVKTRKNYMVEVRSSGYLSDMRKVEIPAAYIGETFFSNYYLEKIAVGTRVVLKNIFFETGKAVLTTASFEELDKLTNIMNENPAMRIEISGHTDNTGSADLNNRLSLDRANSVAGYIIGKGIDRSRIETRGFGSGQPVESNATAEGRAANRRVEFKILEF